MKEIQPPYAGPGERFWFVTYGIAGGLGAAIHTS